MTISTPMRVAALCIASLVLVGAAISSPPRAAPGSANPMPEHDGGKDAKDGAIAVHYLEIVTASVTETCDVLAKAHGVEFGDPIPTLGNARTAELKDGGRIGVRAPMRATEKPVVRPYLLVDDIQAAIKAAEAAGATIAIPPMELPGQGTFAIYILGGIDHGLWQN